MNWSELPSRKKYLYLGLTVLIMAILIIIALSSRNKDVGASSSDSGAPALDSGFDQQSTGITFKTVDSTGSVTASFLDGLVYNDSREGVVGETDATGLGTLSLSDGCWTAMAKSKSSNEEGKLDLAVGEDATNCATGATKILTANSEPILINLK